MIRNDDSSRRVDGMFDPVIHTLASSIDLVLSSRDHIKLSVSIRQTLVQRIGSRGDGLNFERLGMSTGAHF